jgi:hypothetical protein
MSYTCPICKCNGTKHIRLYGANLINECPICLSINTDDNSTIEALECGHILHTECINELINYRISQIDHEQHITERREDRNIHRDLFQRLISVSLYYNESADLTDSYIFNTPFVYCDIICKWGKSYNNNIVLYLDRTLEVFITVGLNRITPWPFGIENYRIIWNNLTEIRGYWTMILN